MYLTVSFSYFNLFVWFVYQSETTGVAVDIFSFSFFSFPIDINEFRKGITGRSKPQHGLGCKKIVQSHRLLASRN